MQITCAARAEWGSIMSFFTVFVTLLKSSGYTIFLFVLVVLLAIPLGFGITMLCRSRFKPLAWLARAYIYIVRGTPLLLQLLFFCFGLYYLPFIGPYIVIQDRFAAAAVAFIINYAAYFAEIFRGGLLAVDKGQYEAAQVLGLSRRQTMVKIIIPQMIRVCMPTLGNEAVTLVKDTALMYAVGIVEVLSQAKSIVNGSMDISAYLAAAIIYLILNTVLSFGMKRLEKRFSHGQAQ